MVTMALDITSMDENEILFIKENKYDKIVKEKKLYNTIFFRSIRKKVGQACAFKKRV